MQTLITANTLSFTKPNCGCGIVSKALKGFGVRGDAPSSQQRKTFLSRLKNQIKTKKKQKQNK